MSLSENLYNLRKIKKISQEELAEKLNVSRQAVSKWESGSGYPETEKIIAICEIFDCSMDQLVKGKISEDIKSEKNNYDEVMTKTSKGIALAIGIILLGVSIMLTLMGIFDKEESIGLIGVVCILIAVVFALPLFIINGTKVDDFKKKNPVIANVYSEEEQETKKSKFTKFIALGISIILIGVIAMMLLMGLKVFSEEQSVLNVAVLMYFITIGVPVIVLSSKLQEKYDIEKYNEENSEEYKKVEGKIGKICGIIMIFATIIFLLLGFLFNMWHINWIVFSIGGMLCGITAIILQKK